MDKSLISAKQKRLKEWTRLYEGADPGPYRLKFLEALKSYRNLLAKCWETECVRSENLDQISDLERRLSQLADDLRLRSAN